ncbi:hypothetical protein [Halolamina sp.]|jgi:hypothetical protein|uniref:hypothetical protein n=1 Tax=Halolamina sp. TaxID=1940283 RepID=UPI000223B712|nr:hypothetical protein Halar_1304 [halophilic archaeon DL31]
MTDADSVAAALARLVNGTADRAAVDNTHAPMASSTEKTPAAVVAEAETVLERLPAAGRFVADGGEQRLHGAIDTATGEDESLAERGRAVRTTLEAFRAAARTHTHSEDGQE